MRRRYTRRRARTRVRLARRGLYLRPRTRAYSEVKYADVYLEDKGVITETAATNVLRLISVQHGDLLTNIPVGTARNNRIGSKIHVKKIVIKQSVNICGFTYNNKEYWLNSLVYRLMVTNTPYGVDMPAYWGNTTCKDKTICPINRRTFNVHFDKNYNLTTGFYNGNTVGSTTSHTSCGMIRHVSASIPVNRTVEFTDTGAMKEQDDIYTVAAIAQIPNFQDVGDVPVVACVNSFVRIYYTDN